MEYTVDELNELATLIAKFNAQNAPIPGHKSFVHINSLEDYGTPAPNGAVCALHFSEHTFGKDFDSKFEFVSFFLLFKDLVRSWYIYFLKKNFHIL